MKKIQALIATIAVLGAQLAQAQSQSLKVVLDPAQTQVRWKLGADLHKVDGTFKLKSGEFIFNPSTGVAEGEILIDATTGESGNRDRDKRMHDEVLESTRYPAIFFHPTQVKGAFKPGETTQQVQAQGTFNIHGADHAMEVPVKVDTAGNTVTATTHFSVPYVAWGMKNPSKLLLRVSKQVEIEVIAKGTIKQVEKGQAE
ncbi:MAG TPA: YceI family protein [Acidobacteriaceae bacterium]|nr:YceI family protein [Acidobacteriaceae bacterium]